MSEIKNKRGGFDGQGAGRKKNGRLLFRCSACCDEETIEFGDKERGACAGNRGDARKARIHVARDIKDVRELASRKLM